MRRKSGRVLIRVDHTRHIFWLFVEAPVLSIALLAANHPPMNPFIQPTKLHFGGASLLKGYWSRAAKGSQGQRFVRVAHSGSARQTIVTRDQIPSLGIIRGRLEQSFEPSLDT